MSRASSSSKEGNLDSVVRPLVILEVAAMEPEGVNEDNFGDEIFDESEDRAGEVALGLEGVIDR